MNNRSPITAMINRMLSLLTVALVAPLFLSAQQVSIDKSTCSLQIINTNDVITIRAIADNAVRVRVAPENTAIYEELIFTDSNAPKTFKVKESADKIEMLLPAIRVVFDRTTQALSYFTAEGQLLLAEKPQGRVIRNTTDMDQPTLDVSQAFVSPTDEHLFGTGQFQDGQMNVRDLPRRLTQVNSQISIPMVVSDKGYGLLWHNYGLSEFNRAYNKIEMTSAATGQDAQTVDITTTEGNRREVRRSGDFTGTISVDKAGRYAFMLDVGQTMARRHHVEIDGQTVVDFSNYWLPPTTSWHTELSAGVHTVRVLGNANDKPTVWYRPSEELTTWSSPVSDGIDYVVFAGSADQVIATYQHLTGGVPMMPQWAMGYIHCRERYNTQDEVLENAAEFRKRNLPIDMIVQDWQYWGKYGWNAMRFDEERYPDPKAMVDSLHQMNIKFMVSVWSKIDPEAELGKVATEKGYYIPQTQWIDFFNPEARDFYWKNFSSRLATLGIDAWWQDATEPENDDIAGRKIFLGSGNKYRDIYPLFVNQTVYDGLRNDFPDKRAMILTRCAFAGQQRYASATWSGDIGYDWQTLRRQIPAGLNFVITGQPWWTTDTGGFFRPSDQYDSKEYEERFVRWLQYSTFCPLQRVHGYMTNTEPWHYGETLNRLWAMYTGFRYRLLPYTYSTAATVSFDGGLVMRPLVMDFADDSKAMEQSYEYMYGRSILVAPVTEPDIKSMNVYLPEGARWVDFWSGKTFEGGQDVDCPTPLDQIPLYVRCGSIVPLGSQVEYSAEQSGKPVEIRVYGGEDADFVLYEDDGESYDYEKGECSRIRFHWNDRSGKLTIFSREGEYEGMLRSRVFEVVLVSPENGTGIENSSHGTEINYTGRKVSVDLR